MAINKKIILTIACLSHFFLGSLLSTTGIFIGYAARDYHLDSAGIGNVFTFFNTGLFISITLTGHLIQKILINRILIFSCYLAIFSVGVLNFYHDIYSYTIIMLILGLSSGSLISSTSYLVIKSIKNSNQSTAKLLLTDFFFSFAGILLPIVFASLLSFNFTWFRLYNIIMVPCVIILYLQTHCEINSLFDNKIWLLDNAIKKWNLSLNLIALTSLFFILSELVLTMWLVKYLMLTWDFTLLSASLFLTSYWVTRAIGLLANQYTLLKLGIQRYLNLSIWMGMFIVSMMMQSHSKFTFLACLLTLGFINSGIYSTLVGYACLQIGNPCPKAVSYIYSSGTIGTLISAWLSGMAVQYLGLRGAIQLVVFSYSMCFILINVLNLMNSRRQSKAHVYK